MHQKVDVYVREPEVGINPGREAVFIQFQVVGSETREGAAIAHTVLMPVLDAMRLLQRLSHIQKRFCLPQETGGFAMIEIPERAS